MDRMCSLLEARQLLPNLSTLFGRTTSLLSCLLNRMSRHWGRIWLGGTFNYRRSRSLEPWARAAAHLTC
jgi:hypothetical protein